MVIMKYFAFFIFITLISTSLFADEIMSCRINNEQSMSYKLQSKLFSDDKIFYKSGVKWIEQCPCEKVENKTVSCEQGQKKSLCNNFFGCEYDVGGCKNITIDFELNEIKLQFSEKGKLISFKCNLVK